MVLGLCDMNTVSLEPIKAIVNGEIRKLIEEIESKTDKYMRFANFLIFLCYILANFD
jgi:hypothetical protein